MLSTVVGAKVQYRLLKKIFDRVAVIVADQTETDFLFNVNGTVSLSTWSVEAQAGENRHHFVYCEFSEDNLIFEHLAFDETQSVFVDVEVSLCEPSFVDVAIREIVKSASYDVLVEQIRSGLKYEC